MRKSPCCKAVVWLFGKRRRRCSRCRRTWRVWQRKRGRPQDRTSENLLGQVFLERRTLTQIAKRKGLTKQTLSYRFACALRRFLRRVPAPRVPDGDLILLTDGLWFRFRGRQWVLYLMAVRPLTSNRAMFVDPYMLQGRESKSRWARVIKSLPRSTYERVRALVCDNYAGSTSIARDNGWVLQLCQFHMLGQLRPRLGYYRPRAVPAKALRQEAFNLVGSALDCDEASLPSITTRIAQLIDEPTMHWRFVNILREFVRRISDYRAYRNHPRLQLPGTTGAVESMGRVIRDLLRQTRSLSTPESTWLWVTAYLRLRPHIACNPARSYTE